MKKEIICTVCPTGCRMMVEGGNNKVENITDYGCKRGLDYGEAEFLHPVRILTTTVKTLSKKYPLVPVRSCKPIPKEKMFECMDAIRKIVIKNKVECYDVIIPNVCGTGIDIVATGSLGGVS